MHDDGFVALLQLLAMILGGAILVFAAIGFWRGLSVRPHEPENRPAKPPFWWYTGP